MSALIDISVAFSQLLVDYATTRGTPSLHQCSLHARMARLSFIG